MADYVEIFFATEESEEQIRAVASEAVEAEFTFAGEPYAKYLAQRDGMVFDLAFEHPFDEEDLGIPFPALQKTLAVRGPSIERPRHEETAMTVFTRLRDHGYRPIYLVFALQHILAKAD